MDSALVAAWLLCASETALLVAEYHPYVHEMSVMQGSQPGEATATYVSWLVSEPMQADGPDPLELAYLRSLAQEAGCSTFVRPGKKRKKGKTN